MNNTKQKSFITVKKKQEITATLNHFYANPVAKASLELFLTIGLILFLGIFAIKPTIITMSDLLKEIETKKEINEALTKKIAALQTAQTQYLNIETKIPLLNTAIPEQPEIILNAKIIEKIAAESRVVITNLSIAELPDETQADLPFSKKSKENISISINITGDYPSIRKFVESLRNSRKSFVVESVTLSLQENRGNKKLNAKITVAAPYFGISNTNSKITKK